MKELTKFRIKLTLFALEYEILWAMTTGFIFMAVSSVIYCFFYSIFYYRNIHMINEHLGDLFGERL